MTAESARFGALSAGALAVAVALVGAWLRSRPGQIPEAPAPVVGRTASETARDPAGRFAHVRKTSMQEAEAARRSVAFEALDREAGPVAWPGPWNAVVLHAFPGPLAPASGEEGPPWHLVLTVDGGVELTPRLRAGRPGVPDGYPATEGRKRLHVAIPRAADMSSGRRQALASVLGWLCHRLGTGPEKIFLAGEVQGQGIPLPPGVTRESLLPAELGK